jgi:hypothetical protein
MFLSSSELLCDNRLKYLELILAQIALFVFPEYKEREYRVPASGSNEESLPAQAARDSSLQVGLCGRCPEISAGEHGRYVRDEFPHAIEYPIYAYIQTIELLTSCNF